MGKAARRPSVVRVPPQVGVVQVRLNQGLGCPLYRSVARAPRVTDQQFLRHDGMRWRAVFDKDLMRAGLSDGSER